MLTRRVGTAVAVVAAALPALPATAAWQCFGTAATAVVCVDDRPYVVVLRGGTYSDCVYLGGDTCTPVSVTHPGARPTSACAVAASSPYLADAEFCVRLPDIP